MQSQVTQAVITVPAYFEEPQKRATLLAARMAGLKVHPLPSPATFVRARVPLSLDLVPRGAGAASSA